MSLAQIHAKLTRIQVAGCTCQTKTPELQYHDERCHFRLAREAQVLLDQLVLPEPHATAPMPA